MSTSLDHPYSRFDEGQCQQVSSAFWCLVLSAVLSWFQLLRQGLLVSTPSPQLL